MTETQIIKEIMKFRGWSQQRLADEAGFKRQSNVSNLLNCRDHSMRTDNLVRLLQTLGCEIVVRDKMGSKKEWVLNYTKTIEEQLVDGEISFDEAIDKGWRPTPEMVERMLGKKN